MAKLDPTKMKDWEIADAAAADMKTIREVAEKMGIQEKELFPYGHYVGKVDYVRVLERLKDKPNGKYIDVTAITPTPSERARPRRLWASWRVWGRSGNGSPERSGSPRRTDLQHQGERRRRRSRPCIPLTDFSLGLTGDIDAISNAHNLAMVAMTSRIQHEFNYTDSFLSKRNLKRLDIDPRNPAMGWTIDFSAQALREILIGLGGKMDGFLMKSGFQITVSSEVMAILAVARDLKDLRERMGRIVVAYSKSGKPVTAEDLEVAGAMTAIMHKAINPNLMQTIEGQPVFVHAGPFANIAIGQSSIIADRLALKLSDYHVTESGSARTSASRNSGTLNAGSPNSPRTPL
jgi:formate--tetrahydrofolate ligase